jgi:rhamnosyltransferase subunit B
LNLYAAAHSIDNRFAPARQFCLQLIIARSRWHRIFLGFNATLAYLTHFARAHFATIFEAAHAMTLPAPASTGIATGIATHFIIVTGGTAGDLYPFLSLGKALQAKGHRVSFRSPEVFGPQIEQAGMAFAATIGREAYATVLNDPDVWHPKKSFGVLWRATRDKLLNLYDAVAALPPDVPCVLLAHPLALPTCALARVLRPGLPIVALYLAPSNLRTCYDPLMLGPLRIPRWVPLAWRQWLWRRVDSKLIDPVALPDMNAVHAKLGLPAIEHYLEHMYRVADFSVTLFPNWFAPTPPDWPQPLISGEFQLFEPSNAPTISPELQAFLGQGSAPLVFTPGSGHRHANEYFVAAVAATQKLGRRAVLVTGHRAQVPANLPDGVLWQEYVAFRDLLPHAALVVHHGGIGTTAEALRAGVPQLVVPFAHDQFDNGWRVEMLGVGTVLPATRLNTRRLVKRLQGLLEAEPVRLACATVAARFASAPGAAELVAQIEARLAQTQAGQVQTKAGTQADTQTGQAGAQAGA